MVWPAWLTSFVGRERELAEVCRLARTTRMLTLTGPGGIGKTRLAVEAAGQLAGSFPDGLVLVELARVEDPRVVPRAVAAALGVHEQSRRNELDVLAEALGARRLLLVLDNCEHLVDACAQLAASLLRACPSLTIVATSRQRLGVDGETIWPVPSLSLTGARGEAVDLFETRARAVAPGFRLSDTNERAVAEICQRLDGVPLAIELAAAHARVLSAQQIADRLGDHLQLLSGGRTLRATLDWSFQLLTSAEQEVFARLSVFRGGWTLDAAESVCPPDPLDTLTHLVDKSLVLVETAEPGSTRYRLLETVRLYAAERLEERPEADAVRARHADFYASLAERSRPHTPDAEFTTRLRELDADHENLRAALRWLVDGGQLDAAARLGAALALFWFLRGHRVEGRQWLDEILALPGTPGESAVQAMLLFGSGLIALHQGDYAAVRAPLEDALGMWARVADRAWMAYAHYALGLLEWQLGSRDAATRQFSTGLQVARAASDHTVDAFNLRGLALVALDDGAFAESRAWARQALALAAHPRSICQALNILGECGYREGDYGIARDLLQSSVARARELGEPILVAVALPVLAHVLIHQGDPVSARRALTECLAYARGLGDRQRLSAVFEGFAHLAAAQRQPDRSARLASAASALRETLGAPTSASERAATARWLDPARRALSAHAAAVADAEGRAMTLNEAIECALAEDPKPAPSGLTHREAEIAALVASGLTNLQIAQRLIISERTVESHVSHSLGKLGLRGRAHLASWAVEHVVQYQAPR